MNNLVKYILVFLFIPTLVMAQTSLTNSHQLVLNVPVKKISGLDKTALITTMVTFFTNDQIDSRNTDMKKTVFFMIGDAMNVCTSHYGLDIPELNICINRTIKNPKFVFPFGIVIYDINVLSSKSYN